MSARPGKSRERFPTCVDPSVQTRREDRATPTPIPEVVELCNSRIAAPRYTLASSLLEHQPTPAVSCHTASNRDLQQYCQVAIPQEKPLLAPHDQGKRQPITRP